MVARPSPARCAGTEILFMAEMQSHNELREGGQTFAEMFEESLTKQDAVKEGEIVKGRVIEIENDMVLLDIGYKSEATVQLSEFTSVEGSPGVKVDDIVDVYIESREDDSGLV